MSVQTDFLPQSSGTKERSSISRALIITRREFRDMLRDWRIVSPIVTLVFILPFLLSFVLTSNNDFLIKQLTPETYNTRLLPFAMLAIGFLPMSFCLVIALESFVGEKERNSLEALMSAPMTDLELILGKYIAAVIPTVMASSFASMTFWVCMWWMNGKPLPIRPDLAIVFIALNMVEALVMVAASVLVSTHTTSVRAANIMASFVILPMSVVVQLEAILLLFDLFNGMYFLLLALIILLVIMLRASVKIFNREDIVSREGDNFTFGSLKRSFAYFFKRTPAEALAQKKTGVKWTIWRFYTKDIPQIIWMARREILIVLVCVLTGIGIAFWMSSWPEAATLKQAPQITTSLQHGTTIPLCQSNANAALEVAGFGEVTWARLFLNNAIVVAIAGAIGLFSLGLAGIGMLMLSIGPMGFIGGLVAQFDINPVPLFFGFILPHGIFELPAAIIGVAVGMRMGLAVLAPQKGLTLGQSFQLAIVNYIKIQAFTIPVLLIAAIIEANLTPAVGCWITGGKF